MSIAIGDKVPEATLRAMTSDGPAEFSTSELCAGKKAVLFGLPGAFTGVCTSAHLPSFIRTADGFAAKGVDFIACISVNDVFVMQAWAEATGADKSPIQMLCDTDASFTKALGLDFSAPPVGLIDRSKRYAMIIEDGVVTNIQVEDSPGECTISAGESLLETL